MKWGEYDINMSFVLGVVTGLALTTTAIFGWYGFEWLRDRYRRRRSRRQRLERYTRPD